MTETARNKLIGELKTEIHKNPDLTIMNDEELRRLVVKALETRISKARTGDSAA